MLVLWLLVASAEADELNQAAWDLAFGLSRTVGWGFGGTYVRTDNDLFERVDPTLDWPALPMGGITAVYWGLGGGGSYWIDAAFTAPSPVRTTGAVSAQAPFEAHLSMGYGIDPVGLIADEAPAGLGLVLGLHAGNQGWQRVSVDKVGELRFAEIGHVHLGVGLMPWISPTGGLALMGGVLWMPARQSNFTLGKFEGYGRFASDGQVGVPPGWEGSVIEGLVELENHLIVEDDFAWHARVVAGPVGLSYHYRRVRYAAKAGAGVPTDSFDQWTHMVEVAWVGHEDRY